MTMQTFPPTRTFARAIPAAISVILVVLAATMPAGAHDDTYAEDFVPAEVRGDGATFAAEGDRTVHDITFPLPAGSYAPLYDSYYNPRSGGRVHRANDLMADHMTPVHAVVDGEIIFAPGTGGEEKPSYGYMIRLEGDDGMFYSYVHLNDDADPGSCDRSGGPEVAYAPGIAKGVQVERGQHIGWVGSSGNASCSGPHLHFEIGEDRQFSVRHNPMESLEAAEERGDFPESVTPAPPSADPPAPAPSEPTAPGDGDDDEETFDEGAGDYTRLAGLNRVQTAVALSQETREQARAVIIVPAGTHAEALVAAPLAGLIGAPILLSGPDGLDQAVATEVERLGAPNAYLIGTREQLSDAVEQDLAAAGVRNHARISEPDRYALSAAVAEEMLTYPELPTLDQVVLSLGDAQDSTRSWPDALSASALAAHTTTPVLLTAGDQLPQPVADLLAAQQPSEVLVIGGTAAISESVASHAASAAGGSAVRLAGPNRYATSVIVADAARSAGLDDAAIWVATGLNFPDALAAGPAAALSGSPLVLVDGQNVAGAPDSTSWLAQHAEDLMVVGGSAVITDEVAGALAG